MTHQAARHPTSRSASRCALPPSLAGIRTDRFRFNRQRSGSELISRVIPTRRLFPRTDSWIAVVQSLLRSLETSFESFPGRGATFHFMVFRTQGVKRAPKRVPWRQHQYVPQGAPRSALVRTRADRTLSSAIRAGTLPRHASHRRSIRLARRRPDTGK